VDVLHLECGDVGAAVEEERLAVAAILGTLVVVMKSKREPLTLPVAPQHASLASSSTTDLPFALSSSERYLAAEVPVMPLPTITTSASAGRSSVVRWPSRNWLGSLCQNESDEVGVGRVARCCFMLVGLVGEGFKCSGEGHEVEEIRDAE
jgi:hypothetical protein